MKSRFDIVTIGAATRDVFLRSADFHVIQDDRFLTGQAECVALGTKINIATLILSTGGGATNAAATFARLGFRTAFVGKIGDDDHGRAVLRDLQDRSIDVRFVARDPRYPTAFSVLLSTYHRGRTVLIYRGASQHLRLRDFPSLSFSTRWGYLTSLGREFSLFRSLVHAFRRKRIPLFCNPGSSELAHRRQVLPLLSRIPVVLLNREEANRLAGTRGLTVPALLRRLQKQLKGILVITDEANGAWAHAHGRVYHSEAHRASRVVERTGAGDAFGSGFLSGLLSRDGDISYALQLGTANAESVMKKVGAKKGILTRPPAQRQLVRVHLSPIFE